jgi:RNA polymerase sigma-70 factor (ECF subfamily)
MAEPTVDVLKLINKVKGGDRAAREQLIAHAFAQMERMARKRLDASFRRLRQRGIETGDVLNDALLTLVKRLERGTDLDRLASEKDFYVMVAQYIRWALLNMVNRPTLSGPELPPDDFLAGETAHPFSAEQMAAFHAAVEGLPQEQRETFELLYYSEHSYDEAARLLEVPRDTIKRRYREAKDALKSHLQG